MISSGILSSHSVNDRNCFGIARPHWEGLKWLQQPTMSHIYNIA